MVESDTEQELKQLELDRYFMMEAKNEARFTSCRKKELGAVLVLKSGILLKGHNGPPEELSRCNICPRIGRGGPMTLWECRAVHAERAVLLQAARHGTATEGSTLYAYMGVPCKDCMLELIAAGVTRIVVERETYYDEMSRTLVSEWLQMSTKHHLEILPLRKQ